MDGNSYYQINFSGTCLIFDDIISILVAADLKRVLPCSKWLQILNKFQGSITAEMKDLLQTTDKAVYERDKGLGFGYNG